MSLSKRMDNLLDEIEISCYPEDLESKIIFPLLKKHNNFLKQHLTLSMFVPCDEEGNVMQKPKVENFVFEDHDELVGCPKEYDHESFQLAIHKYQQAKKRVLFKGLCSTHVASTTNNDYHIVHDINGCKLWVTWNNSKTIEYLLNVQGLELTQSAINQLK